MDMSGHDMSMGASGCQISMLWNWYTIDSCFLAESWHVRTNAQFFGTVFGIFLMVVAIEGLRRMGREYDRRLVSAYNAKKALVRCSCGPSSRASSTPASAKSSSRENVASCHSAGGLTNRMPVVSPAAVLPEIQPAEPKKSSCCGGGKSGSTQAPVIQPIPIVDEDADFKESARMANMDASAEAGGYIHMQCRPKVPSMPSWGQQIWRGLIYGTHFTGAFLVMLLGMYYNGYVLIFGIFSGAIVGNIIFSSDTVGSVGEIAKSESPCCC